MLKIIKQLIQKLPAPVVHAHCDGPCGIYDPSSARIAAEAVLSMTKKIIALEKPPCSEKEKHLGYHNTLTRYVHIKEDEAQKCKEQLLILWTDYFKPPHLEKFPDLHNVFWQAAKACSTCKVEVSLEHAEELLEKVKAIHDIFWKSKGKEVPWMTVA